MKPLITTTTDFGDQFASAQLLAVVASLGFNGRIIQNHSVGHFSILEGAFQILTLAKFSPENAVHLGVVDPGVGSQRRGVVIRTRRSWLVGPDNGLLYPVANKEKIMAVWQLQESEIGDEISQTFHGRDVFIKAAVYLAQGQQPEEFGSIKMDSKTLEKLDFKPGQVLHIDHYGNVKIFWPQPTRPGGSIYFKKGKLTSCLPVVRTFSDVPRGRPLALWGSSNTLELAVNLDSGAQAFQISPEDCLEISYTAVPETS